MCRTETYERCGAHELGRYMPKAMAAIGTEMHRTASRFAEATSDAAVAGDVKPALAALSEVTRQCVACHSGFRVLCGVRGQPENNMQQEGRQ